MEIFLDRDGSIEKLKARLNDRICKNFNSFLILACEGNRFTENRGQLDEVLRLQESPIFGGIFPQIIHQRERLDKGTIIIGFHRHHDVYTIKNLSDPMRDLDDSLDTLIPSTQNKRTMMVFFDGFSQRINDLVDSLFTIFGMEMNYLGGGAGCINGNLNDLTPKPCIFTNEGLIADAAQLIVSDAKSGIGVSHGWSKIDGPYKVTKSSGNSIVSLDWEPAFQVYKKVVEKHSGKLFTNNNFFSIAKGYPLGLARFSNESIVRDPFSVQENNIVFGIPIPSESFVDILTGDIASLPESVKKALRDAKESYHSKEMENCYTVFFNCISRVLFLGKKISDEIETVASNNTPLFGAFTMGEIANTGKEFLEYYNKTSVVGILEK